MLHDMQAAIDERADETTATEEETKAALRRSAPCKAVKPV
jgi:hypothetical protein